MAASEFSRLYEIARFSIPPNWLQDKSLMAHINEAQTAGFNDPLYNKTYLAHNLIIEGIVPNAMIADVMDIVNNLLCYEYV